MPLRGIQGEAFLAGVGIGLARDAGNGAIVVTRIVPSGPASKHEGVHVGDMISYVDGHATKQWTVQQVVECLKGPPGSKVHLGITRGQHVSTVEIARTLHSGQAASPAAAPHEDFCDEGAVDLPASCPAVSSWTHLQPAILKSSPSNATTVPFSAPRQVENSEQYHITHAPEPPERSPMAHTRPPLQQPKCAQPGEELSTVAVASSAKTENEPESPSLPFVILGGDHPPAAFTPESFVRMRGLDSDAPDLHAQIEGRCFLPPPAQVETGSASATQQTSTDAKLMDTCCPFQQGNAPPAPDARADLCGVGLATPAVMPPPKCDANAWSPRMQSLHENVHAPPSRSKISAFSESPTSDLVRMAQIIHRQALQVSVFPFAVFLGLPRTCVCEVCCALPGCYRPVLM